MLVLPHGFPLGLVMPSSLRMRAISRVDFPASDMSNTRLTTLRRIGIGLQLRSLLGSVLDHHPVVAEWSLAGHPKTPGRGLSHPPGDVLGKILRIELVDGLDDAFQESAGGGVVGLLGDRNDADSPAAEHGLVGDGVLPLAGEPGELPDEDLPEGGTGRLGLVEHSLELGPVVDSSALGLVHELADDHAAVLPGVVPERPQLCGHGQVDVLPVTGHPGVERHWCGVVSLTRIHDVLRAYGSDSQPGSLTPSWSGRHPSGGTPRRSMKERTATLAQARKPFRIILRCREL